MAIKPNYRGDRAARTRVQETRKQEKLRRREEASAKRKTLQEGESSVPDPELDKD